MNPENRVLRSGAGRLLAIALGILPLLGLAAGRERPSGRDGASVVASLPSPGLRFGASLATGVALGDTVYFAVTTETNGNQLWKTDGTEEGTTLVTDMGTKAAPEVLTAWRGAVYFVAGEDAHGRELWRTDGTREGTRLIKDVKPGPESSRILELVSFRGELYFAADDGLHGRQIWKTDGTSDGTVRVTDFHPRFGADPYALGLYPYDLTIVGGNLLFFGLSNRSESSYGLWKSDGTAAGTALLASFVLTYPEICGLCIGNGPSKLTAVGDTAYFAANDGNSGEELWRTDGTVRGTHLVSDVLPGSRSSALWDLFAWDGKLFFFAYGPDLRIHAWRSDGTAFGTFPIADGSWAGYRSTNFALLGRALLFTNSTGIWRSDGTPSGTFPLRSMSVTGGPRAAEHGIVFSGDDSIHGDEPWVTDGTPTGTRLLADLVAGGDQSAPWFFAEAGGSVFFTAGAENRLGLWRTDGESVAFVKTIERGSDRNLIPLADLHGRVILAATESGQQKSLWSSDGTASGTRRLAAVATGTLDLAGLPVIGRLGDFVYFGGTSSGGGLELWHTDGTPEGTGLVKQVLPGTSTFGSWLIAASADRLFLTTPDGELWVSDGTEAGTRPVQHFGGIYSAVAVDRTLYFSAAMEAGSPELWKSDGTAQGTVVVASRFAPALVSIGTQLYFWSFGTSGNTLWKSDGTPSGTSLIQTFGSLEVVDLIPVGRRLFFRTANGTAGFNLWTTDGTPDGARLVRDESGRVVMLDWTPPVVSGNRLFFAATDPEHGTELWSSDGTAQGTRLVRDIRPGPVGSTISGVVDVGGVVLFAADDGLSGRELWRSDGTADGTYLVEDLAPDIYSSNPADFVRSGRQVFFTAAGDGPARPLWKIPSEAVGGGLRSRSGSPRVVPPRQF